MLKSSQLAVFAAALVCWGIYFYLMDQSIMEVQGLPVTWNLMPK